MNEIASRQTGPDFTRSNRATSDVPFSNRIAVVAAIVFGAAAEAGSWQFNFSFDDPTYGIVASGLPTATDNGGVSAGNTTYAGR